VTLQEPKPLRLPPFNVETFQILQIGASISGNAES